MTPVEINKLKAENAWLHAKIAHLYKEIERIAKHTVEQTHCPKET